MSRPVWTGVISFGLVSVPVKAYTAVRDHTVHFNQIDRASGSRVRHQNVAQETGEPVQREDIVLGYEVGDGRYVTFERDELEDLRPSSTRAIEVSDFVALSDVDPIYYQRTYWLGPDGEAATVPYRLLLAAMSQRERVAIGSVVMRTKQYLAAIRPLDGVLAMSTMRFADEVLERSSIPELPEPVTDGSGVEKRALDLAVQIVDSLAGDWRPDQYRDTYADQLHELIAERADGAVLVGDGGDDQPSAKVLDLMAALEASVDATRAATKARTAKTGGAPARKAPAKKAAAKKAPGKKVAAKKRRSA